MTKGIVIAAPHSGSGKTVFTMGLAAALKARGLKVQIAKGGPGYIDPQFLSAGAGQPCYNLDTWAMGPGQLEARVAAITADTDLLIVEGTMGMFDGAASMNGSTADLADTLGLPVLLLVDASGQAQSIAALVHGFATLRDRPKLCGVVANRTGSAHHGDLLREALVETNIPMFGAIQRSPAMHIESRHLGLVQATENLSQEDLVQAACEAVTNSVDLDAILENAGSLALSGTLTPTPPLGHRIAVASDIAFSFTYPHLLDDWRRQGAEIELFSPLADEAPSKHCDAIFLPGGYPELHASTLAQAKVFKTGLRTAAYRGARVYGECGGYMVLGRAMIDADGDSHRMVDLLDHVTSFAERKLHLGYRKLSPLNAKLWKGPMRGHEFHYSKLLEPGRDEPLFKFSDAKGQHGGPAGGQRGSVMGSYMHVIDHHI